MSASVDEETDAFNINSTESQNVKSDDSKNVKPWIELEPMPKKYASNPVVINATEFVSAQFTNGFDEDSEETIRYIHKYNSGTNEWTKFTKYPPNFHSQHQSMCVNPSTNELYLYGCAPTLLRINIHTLQTKVVPSEKLVPAGMYAPTVFINNKYHLIAGHKNSCHFVLNEGKTNNQDDKTNDKDGSFEFEKLFEFEGWSVGNMDPGLVNITSKQKLLLFGGYDYGNGTLDEIWIFDYKTEEMMKQGWKKVENLRLPKGTLNSGYTLSADERYVLIFGGGEEYKNMEE